MITPLLTTLGGWSSPWCVPLLHGWYGQRECAIFGSNMRIMLIARRSRHSAGTRYLKRGVTHSGKVGNEVEVEQIVAREDAGQVSSHVQVRGSIPVFWAQEASATNPRAPIVLQHIDPLFHSTSLHFQDLFRRYGAPYHCAESGQRERRQNTAGINHRRAISHRNQSHQRRAPGRKSH